MMWEGNEDKRWLLSVQVRQPILRLALEGSISPSKVAFCRGVRFRQKGFERSWWCVLAQGRALEHFGYVKAT